MAAALFAGADATASTLDDQVQAATTVASIILALLTLFTTRRAQKLAEDRASGIGRLSTATFLTVVPELLLALATFGALAAMSRLFWDSVSLQDWTDRDHVVESLFSLAYIGFRRAVRVPTRVGPLAAHLSPRATRGGASASRPSAGRRNEHGGRLGAVCGGERRRLTGKIRVDEF